MGTIFFSSNFIIQKKWFYVNNFMQYFAIFIFFFGKMNLFKRISFLLACFTMLSFFWALENYDSFTPKMKLYANRYFGQYYKFKDSYRYEREYRNLHIQQSNQSIEYISELPFWGFGYGKVESRNRKNFLETLEYIMHILLYGNNLDYLHSFITL